MVIKCIVLYFQTDQMSNFPFKAYVTNKLDSCGLISTGTVFYLLYSNYKIATQKTFCSGCCIIIFLH